MLQLKQINLYPIKSTLAYPVSQAVVLPQGLNFDREFMLAELDGTFITARKDKDAELYRFSVFPIPQGIYVQHQDGSSCQVFYRDFTASQSCEVWGTHFPSFVAKPEINQWFSEKIGRAVQLRWYGEQSQRTTKREPNHPVSFADGYPISLATQASLAEVQRHCDIPLVMERFRPNLILDGITAFEEQQWQEVQIGEVRFKKIKLCARCVLVARDPETNQSHPKLEPFRTLKKINIDEEGKPIFGILMIPLNGGVIKVGDKAEILV